MLTLFTRLLAPLVAYALPFFPDCGKASRSHGDLISSLTPVDVQCLRNLLDPAEQDYLRAYLKPACFRQVQRVRIQAAAIYTRQIADNAEILLRLLAKPGPQSESPQAALIAQKLANRAVALWICCCITTLVLYMRILGPGARVHVHRIIDQYEDMRTRTLYFARLQMPAAIVRLQSGL